MMLADKAFNEITRADLESLKENGIPESREIEYKKALDLDTPDGKRKFLKQISSFANSSGGHLIYGIREEKGIPVELCGLDLSDQDKAIQRIENLVRDGLDPRLFGFGVRAIPLENGKPAVILRVAKSWNGPHLVKDDGRFYYRHSAVTSPMDASELRNAFLQSAAIVDQVRRYRYHRLALIDAGKSPVGSNPNPKIIVQVIPIESLNAGFQLNWDEVATERVMIMPLGKRGCSNGRLNLDGLVVFNEDRQTKIRDSYLQWFRNGIIETVDAGFLQANPIPGTLFAEHLIKLIQNYTQHMGTLGIAYPIIVSCSLTGVRGHGLVGENNCRSSDSIDRDDLIIPEVTINEPSANIKKSLRPIFEALWNAAGLILTCG